MITPKARLKELAIFMMASPTVQMTISNQLDHPETTNVATVKLFQYNGADIVVQYKKWIVEGYDFASKMKLPGYKQHNKLLLHSVVDVFSKKIGHYNYVGQDAKDIINACEKPRTDKILEMTNNFQNIR